MKWYVVGCGACAFSDADNGVQINFLSMDDAEVEGAKSNLLRTLGAAA